jgi:hypothetical protein
MLAFIVCIVLSGRYDYASDEIRCSRFQRPSASWLRSVFNFGQTPLKSLCFNRLAMDL